MMDELDIDNLIDDMQNTHLFVASEEFQIVNTCANASDDIPYYMKAEMVENTYVRYRRYLRYISFTDETEYIAELLRHFLDTNRAKNYEYEFGLMKKIDNEILLQIQK